MKPKISIITLGVADLTRAKAFYEEGLGFIREEKDLSAYDAQAGDAQAEEGIIFFGLEGTWLALYPKEKLMEDIGVNSLGEGNPSFTLAHNVQSKERVHEVIERARKAGAEIAKEPKEVFWGGYSGYFKDLDGYFWEVAYNPYTDLT